jgi:hypothetical protein
MAQLKEKFRYCTTLYVYYTLGLMYGSVYDVRYSSQLLNAKELNGMHEFNGFTDTRISQVDGTKEWRMELFSDPNTYVTTNATDIMLGEHTFRRDGIDKFTVNLNTCDPDTEYNCKDGTCISIVNR